MGRKRIHIDRDKLRAAVRKLGSERVFYMLDEAIGVLPATKLHEIVKKYLDVEQLRPDLPSEARTTVLTDVKRF